MLGRYLGFGPTATVWTPALMQHPVCHVHYHRWQLKHLMCMVWPEQGQRRVPTCTPLRPHLTHSRGGQALLSMARMARFPTCFAGRSGGGTLAELFVGRVRRRRPVRGGGVLREASFQ